MFLDTFMDDAPEGIMENPIPELEDLELECAVSLEAAYNDLMLEGCQLKYQEIAEGASVSAINEGVIEAIKNFFKKLFNAIKKFFGFGGGTSTTTNDTITITTNGEGNSNGMNISRIHNPKAMSLNCCQRLRKLMSRPDYEIWKQLEGWKNIEICKTVFFDLMIWHADETAIRYFSKEITKFFDTRKDDRVDPEIDEGEILYKIFKFFTRGTPEISDKLMQLDISVNKICSIYSKYINDTSQKNMTTLYDEMLNLAGAIKYRKIDVTEIDVKEALRTLERDIDDAVRYMSFNEIAWKKSLDSILKDIERTGKDKPKVSAFLCKMTKEFVQIAIFVSHKNRKLFANYLNTLYHALAPRKIL